MEVHIKMLSMETYQLVGTDLLLNGSSVILLCDLKECVYWERGVVGNGL